MYPILLYKKKIENAHAHTHGKYMYYNNWKNNTNIEQSRQ